MHRIIIINLLIISSVFGTSYIEERPQTVSSPEGQTLIRVILNKAGKRQLYIYKINPNTQEYQSVNHFDFEERLFDAYVNEQGSHIVNIGGSMGETHISIYSIDGKELKTFGFYEFYTGAEQRKYGSTISTLESIEYVSWRKKGTELVIDPPYNEISAKLDLDTLVININNLHASREKNNYSQFKRKPTHKMAIYIVISVVTTALLLILLLRGRRNTKLKRLADSAGSADS